MTAFFDVILPFFSLIALGYAARRQNWISDGTISGITQFVFLFALPALLFRMLATRPFEEFWIPDFLLAYGAATILVLGAGFAIGKIFFRLDLGSAALHGFCGGISNMGFMGLPLLIGLWGEQAALPGIVALTFDLFVTFSLLLLLMETDRYAGGAQALRKVVTGWMTNPMMVAILLGGALSGLHIPLPGFFDRVTELLGAAAGPAALFAIGAAMYGRPLSEKVAELSSVTAMKLIGHPLAMAGAFLLWGHDLDPFWIQAGIVICALPTAGNAFLIASHYNRYINRSSAVILVSTAISTLTVSLLAIYL